MSAYVVTNNCPEPTMGIRQVPIYVHRSNGQRLSQKCARRWSLQPQPPILYIVIYQLSRAKEGAGHNGTRRTLERRGWGLF